MSTACSTGARCPTESRARTNAAIHDKRSSLSCAQQCVSLASNALRLRGGTRLQTSKMAGHRGATAPQGTAAKASWEVHPPLQPPPHRRTIRRHCNKFLANKSFLCAAINGHRTARCTRLRWLAVVARGRDNTHRRVLHVRIELEELGHVAAQLRHGGQLIQFIVVHHPGQAANHLRT